MWLETEVMKQESAIDNLVSIKDASRIIGVPAHTIRYWEKEFSEFLCPPRTIGKQRRYGDRHILNLKTVFKMLRDEGYSIAGAKRALAKQNQPEEMDFSQVEGLSLSMTEKIIALVRHQMRVG